MQSYVTRGLRLAIFLFALLHFINYFTDIPFLETVQAGMGLALVILAGWHIKLRRFKLPLFLMITGVAVLVLTGGFNFSNVQSGLLQMSDIIGLLVIVPVIGWVLRQEPYIEEMIGLAHKLLNSSQKFYYVTISFTHILAYFLLFGVITLMHQIVSRILRHQSGEAWEFFKGTALVRGFSLSTLWIISIPSFAFAVEALNASLWQAVLQGSLVAAAAIVMAGLFFHVEKKRYGVDFTAEIQQEIASVIEESSDRKVQIKKTVEFIFLFITLFGTIFLLYGLLDVQLMLLIPFVIVVWALLYFAVKRKPRNMLGEMKDYYRNGLSAQGYQFSVMTSAGVLILALNQGAIGEAMIDSVYSLQDVIPFFNMLYFLPFIVIILGFMGLGPLTVMVLVAGILETISLPYSQELIVLAITSGSAISIMLSPLIMPVIILSSINGMSPIKNGFRFNYKYAIAFYVLVQIYIQTVAALG